MKQIKEKLSVSRKMLNKDEITEAKKRIKELRDSRELKTYIFTEYFNAQPSKEKRVYSI